MATYVYGDIHGNGKKFFDSIKELNITNKDNVILLGDIIDRGDDAFTIYDFLMEHKNFKLLLGNHEIALLNVENAIRTENWKRLEQWKNYWFEGEGEDTYLEFFGEFEPEKRKVYVDFLNSCDIDYMLKIKEKYHYFVHAAISNDIFEKVSDRKIMTYLASENYDICVRESLNGKLEVGIMKLTKEEKEKAKIDNWVLNPTVWFGHTPTKNWQSGKIRSWKQGIFNNIDCGCNGRTNFGKLCVVRLEDEKKFYF